MLDAKCTELMQLGMSGRVAERCLTTAAERGLDLVQVESLISRFRQLQPMYVGYLYRWLTGLSQPPAAAETTN